MHFSRSFQGNVSIAPEVVSQIGDGQNMETTTQLPWLKSKTINKKHGGPGLMEQNPYPTSRDPSTFSGTVMCSTLEAVIARRVSVWPSLLRHTMSRPVPPPGKGRPLVKWNVGQVDPANLPTIIGQKQEITAFVMLVHILAKPSFLALAKPPRKDPAMHQIDHRASSCSRPGGRPKNRGSPPARLLRTAEKTMSSSVPERCRRSFSVQAPLQAPENLVVPSFLGYWGGGPVM